LLNFYRTLMEGTLLLPGPPGHGDEAKAALESAVNDEEEVEVSVLLAADGEGNPVSVCFASVAALAAWAPQQTASLPLPARIAIANMAASGAPAIMDPAGPIPYRFEPDELTALAAGRLPGSDGPLFAGVERRSIRLRVAGPEALPIEARLAESLRATEVDAAWLVESEAGGQWRLMLGLLGGEGASATVDVPDRTDVVWLEEPLLASVRAIARPFYRRGRR
ncbi:MAG: SseB family protein, partial [Chloroflexota bacterium]|nr:SseB family protein [Chloroflexota bacterium]